MSTIIKLYDYDEVSQLAEIAPLDVSIDYGINKSAEFSFKIPINTLQLNDYIQGRYVSIFLDGVLLCKGQIQELTYNYNTDYTVEIKGRDFLDLLYQTPPVALGYFVDMSYFSILATLLFWRGWQIGDVSEAYAALEQVTTIDLRSKQSLAEQINDLLNAAGGFQYRLSEQGVRKIDIGTFSKPVTLEATQQTEVRPKWRTIHITDVQGSIDSDYAIGAVSAKGGTVKTGASTSRNVTLYDGLTSDKVVTNEYALVEHLFNTDYSLYNRLATGLGGSVYTNVAVTGSAPVHNLLLGGNNQIAFSKVLPAGKLGYMMFRVHGVSTSLTSKILAGTVNLVVRVYSINGNPQTGPLSLSSLTQMGVGYFSRFPVYANNNIQLDFTEKNIILPSSQMYVILMYFAQNGSDFSGEFLTLNVRRENRVNTKTWVGTNAARNDVPVSSFVLDTNHPILPFFVQVLPYQQNGNWLIKNEILEEYKSPTDTILTTPQISTIGAALYTRTKATIDAKRAPRKKYSISTQPANELLLPGSYVELFFNQQIASQYVNLNSEKLKIETIKFSYKDSVPEFELGLSDLPLAEYTDPFVAAKTLTPKTDTGQPAVDTSVDLASLPTTIQVVPANVTLTNLAANAIMPDGRYAYQLSASFDFLEEISPGILEANSYVIFTTPVQTSGEYVDIVKTTGLNYLVATSTGWNNTKTVTLRFYCLILRTLRKAI